MQMETEISVLVKTDYETLQKELKENFSCYKEYFHDYEEVYFSICNIKKIIENSTNKLNSLFVNAS